MTNSVPDAWFILFISSLFSPSFFRNPPNQKAPKVKEQSLKSVSTTVRCGPVRGSCTRTPSTGTTIGISREATVNTLRGLVSVWTPDAHHILVLANHAVAVSAVASTGEGGDDGSKFALEHDNSLLDYHIRFKITDALNVDVEVVWLGVVVEGLVGGGSVFPGGVVGDWPFPWSVFCLFHHPWS